jgi:UDP:flavonoid glycosyltransferase YjiC (YdhE family)
VAAKKFQLPIATIGLAAYLWPTAVATSDLLAIPGKEEFVSYRHSRMLGIFAEICDLFGLPVSSENFFDLDNTPLIGDMHFLRSVPELQGDINELPKRVHLVGDCLWEPSPEYDDELETWLDRAPDEPLIYVQHVSGGEGIPDYWPNLVEALRSQPIRVVAAINQISLGEDSLPDNFFVRTHIPYASILPRASAVICAGTTNSVLHPLALGLPLLLIPIGGEQPDVAYRCEKAGVAHCLYPFNVYTKETMPENVSVAALTQAIQTLLSDDDPVRKKAQKMQKALAGSRVLDTAVDLLEQLALERDFVSEKAVCK